MDSYQNSKQVEEQYEQSKHAVLMMLTCEQEITIRQLFLDQQWECNMQVLTDEELALFGSRNKDLELSDFTVIKVETPTEEDSLDDVDSRTITPVCHTPMKDLILDQKPEVIMGSMQSCIQNSAPTTVQENCSYRSTDSNTHTGDIEKHKSRSNLVNRIQTSRRGLKTGFKRLQITRHNSQISVVDNCGERVSRQRQNKYSCENCEHIFSSVKSLKEHSAVTGHMVRVKKRITLKPQCKECGKRLCNQQRYKQHIERHRCGSRINEEHNLQCNICSAKFRIQSQLLAHLKMVHVFELQCCTICGQTLKNGSQLKNHVYRYHTEKKYKCNICKVILLRMDSFKGHLKSKKHAQNLEHSDVDVEYETIHMTDDNELKTKSYDVDEDNGSGLEEMDDDFSNKISKSENNTSESEDVIQRNKYHTKKSDYGPDIDQLNNSKRISYESSQLSPSVKIPTGFETRPSRVQRSPYVDDRCPSGREKSPFQGNKSSTRIERSTSRIKSSHHGGDRRAFHSNGSPPGNDNKKVLIVTKRKDYTCCICGATFGNHLSQLTTHLYEQHSDKTKELNILHCNVCSKVFYSSTELNKHCAAEGHKTKKPPSRAVCDKCGRSTSNIYIHRYSQCPFKERKNLTCDKCGKHFDHRGRLKAHLNLIHVEQPVTCNICSKVCRNENALKSHIKGHDKNIWCDVCKVPFRDNLMLKRHCNTQAHGKAAELRSQGFEPKPLETCAVCGCSFATKSALTIHTNKLHKVNT